MTLQQLYYFVDVAGTLHFSKSAENLYISQSNLSYAITSLERELGVALFERQNGKRVVLSKYGEAFLPYARQSLRSIDEGQKHILHIQDPLSGTVRISYGYINGVSLISKMFRQFYADNTASRIKIQFQINNSCKILEKDALCGDADLIFTTSRDITDLEQTVFAKQKLFVYLPFGHPLSKRRSLSIEDIKNEPLIGYHETGNLSKLVSRIYYSSGYSPNVLEYQTDWTAEIACIATGMGIGLLPRIPVDPTAVSIVAFDHPLNERELYLCSKPNLSPAVSYVKN